MVKRIVENVLTSAIVIASTRHGCKRRRTDEFLDQAANFRAVLETCRFFESHLVPHLDIETSQDGKSDPNSISSPQSSAKVLNCLRQSMADFEMTHELYCSQLRESATTAIQLRDAYQSFAAGIDSKKCPTDISHLPMLNLGPDVTNFLKQEISDYAGVPSSSDLQDWQNLNSLLR